MTRMRLYKENAMKQRDLRRLLPLLTAAVLLLLPLYPALAEVTGFVPFPASRVIIGDAPRGMVRQVHTEDGFLRVTIDTEATDWPGAAAAMQFPCGPDPVTGEMLTYDSMYMLDVYLGKPKGAAAARFVIGDIWASDAELLTALRQAPVERYDQGPLLWFDMMRLDHAQGTGTPLQTGCSEWHSEFPYTCAMLWLDAAGNELTAERLILQLGYTDPLRTVSIAGGE